MKLHMFLAVAMVAAMPTMLAKTAFAQAAPDKTLEISKAWVRATPPKAHSAAVYLTVTDQGGPDRLIGASTPVAQSATLHESRTVNGVMQMRPVAGLPVTKDAPIALSPGGFHLMLMGLKDGLKLGQTFPVTLRFEKAGPVTTTVTVEKPGATGPGDMSKDMPGMNDMPGMKMP
jgi:copper(I)-binding protein